MQVVNVPPLTDQSVSCESRQILVKLQAHALRRDRDDAFVGQLHRKGQRGRNMLGSEAWGLIKNRFSRFARREIVEHHIYRHTRPLQTWRAVQPIRRNGNEVAPVHEGLWLMNGI